MQPDFLCVQMPVSRILWPDNPIMGGNYSAPVSYLVVQLLLKIFAFFIPASFTTTILPSRYGSRRYPG